MEINTKEILDKWKDELIKRINKLNIQPELNIIQVGHDGPSNIYINNKIKIAAKLGIKSNLLQLNEFTSQSSLMNKILERKNAPLILQLPIPKNLNLNEIIKHTPYEVDVDGFTTYQKGMLSNNDKAVLVPATAIGVHRIIKSICPDLTGKKVCIINRSNLIGKPLLQLMLNENASVTMLHSKTPIEVLKKETLSSDIVITGCGKRAIFDSTYFKDGQILIDCSMSKMPGINGVGDMDKLNILEHLDVNIASGYGHTGPATVMGLMENVIKTYEIKETL